MFAQINFDSIFKTSPDAYALVAHDLTFAAANDAYLQAVKLPAARIIGSSLTAVFPHESSVARINRRRLSVWDACQVVLAQQTPQTVLLENLLDNQSPAGVCWRAAHTPIFDHQGRVQFILQQLFKTTELQLLQQALGKKQAHATGHRAALPDTLPEVDIEQDSLFRLFEQAPGFICFLGGSSHEIKLANEAFYLLVGRRNLVGASFAAALPELVGQGFVQLLDQVYSSGKPYVGHEVRMLLQRHDASAREELFVDFIYQPIITPDGSVTGILMQGNDVTERQRMQEELDRYRTELEDLVLERTRKLEESEAALRHAQKMEAVGRLTGGIAHDFNNLLQVIGGNLQLMRQDLSDSKALERRLAAAQASVDHGARLASQLLAFARRQPLDPVVVRLDALLLSMEELLRRVLGETIELSIRHSPDLWMTFADPGQIENVVLNLAINARDAMGGAGRLVIEADNISLEEGDPELEQDVGAGDYVRLMVSDTGIGMADDVREQAFEPFFTTKPEGQGTGLGLSMVYGFVKQSGGQVQLISETGQGTVIKIYLPRAFAAGAVESGRFSGPVAGGSETILVAEDDPDVRRTTVDMLTHLGYRVLEAEDASSALALLQAGHVVDLLFTDVIMPGELSSIELARRAKQILPNLLVLFTSGYTNDALIRDGRLEQGVNLLSKPFHHDELARRIRHLFRHAQQVASLRTDSGAVPAAAASPRLRILIVEDEEFIREALQELLADTGYEITVTATAEEAQERLEQRQFHVLFTDVSLPGKSGIELATEAVEKWPGLRVIIASGYGKDLPAPLCEALSDAVFLPKPYDIGEIEAAIERIMQEGDIALH